ncbi:MAG: hypothetical protein LBL79_09050 [Prevotella sp.]|jgi:hypothetical protein|nr:hypothetical protein [Prevotella sp.]
MIAVLFSWAVIFFTLFSLGDIFIRFYNIICKERESYNIPDTFILGICFLSILLPITSLWLPSNHYILLACIIAVIIYWIKNRVRLKEFAGSVKNTLKSFTFLQKVLMGLAVLAVLLHMLFTDLFFDAGFYHLQNIRWNEEYPVVPGLANFEDRYGFNSNYLLLSAIFTFRFIFGETGYMLQTTLYVVILCWAMANLFRSGYDFRYIIILLLLLFVLTSGGYMLANTSTDIIPLLCIFYYIVKTVLRPDWLARQPLMAFLLPITLVAFKVSTALFCLISLAILVSLIKQKNRRVILFLLSASALTIVLWCVRNVIISGYLVYPIYSIDLFNVDWKVPEGTAFLQKAHIYNWAKYVFNVDYIYRITKVGFFENPLFFFNSITNFALFLFITVSPVFVIRKMLKNKDAAKADKTVYSVYLLSLLCIIFGMISAPDFRFVNGYIFGCTFLLITIMTSHRKPVRQAGKYITAGIVSCMLILAVWWDVSKAVNYRVKPNGENLKSLMMFPVHPVYDLRIEEYSMGSFSIFLKVGDDPRGFGLMPVANREGIPFDHYEGDKIQSVYTIEARGRRIQDGFRTKPEYIDIINKNTQRYIEEYQRIHKTKYPAGYFESCQLK